MKKILLTLVLLAFSIVGFSQTTKDVVKLKNGSIVKGTITEMVPNKSIKLSTSDGSVFVYSMEEIEEVYKEEASQNSNSNAGDDLCMKAMNDALSNYHGEGSLRGATWATSIILSPIVGIIPAAIGASTEPNQSQLNCPEPKLYQNDRDYRTCYDQQAMRVKKSKSWGALASSSCVWLGIILIGAIL
ncbi:MAG: hypothetical protein MJZ62_05915 [Bacteroidales bacterium]|nr:hypothetical protein [Bacteroidales bacterium]